MLPKAVPPFLLALLLLQILLGPVVAEHDTDLSAFVDDGLEDIGIDFKMHDLDELGDIVEDFWDNATHLQSDCNVLRQAPVNQTVTHYCGFVDCCINYKERGVDAKSTGKDCGLELIVRMLFSNATLQQDICSNAGPNSRECRFVKCCVSDKRGPNYAKAIGSDCYTSSRSGSGSVSPSSSGSNPIGSQSSGSSSSGFTPVASILCGLGFVFTSLI